MPNNTLPPPPPDSRETRIENAILRLAEAFRECGGHAGYSPSKRIPDEIRAILYPLTAPVEAPAPAAAEPTEATKESV